MRQIRVAPNAAHHGDGYRNAVSPESFTILRRRLRNDFRIRQDSAACVSLPFNLLVKEHLATPILSRPNLTGFEDDEAPTGIVPGREPRGVVRRMPIAGDGA